MEHLPFQRMAEGLGDVKSVAELNNTAECRQLSAAAAPAGPAEPVPAEPRRHLVKEGRRRRMPALLLPDCSLQAEGILGVRNVRCLP